MADPPNPEMQWTKFDDVLFRIWSLSLEEAVDLYSWMTEHRISEEDSPLE